jgi:hypothetical protein
MIRKKLLATVASLSLGIAGYTTLDAATLSPLPSHAGHGVVTYVTQATETFFDYFEEGQPRHRGMHSMTNPPAVQAPYQLLSSEGTEGPSTLGMILASLGMMAIIVHRRRDI